MLRDHIKWWLFPGTNMNARLRYRLLPKHYTPSTQPKMVLDAGCGNGALAYQSYRQNNQVLGVTIKDEVVRNQRLFNQMLGISEERLRFQDLNLYQVASLGENRFDEVICTEVMEHIRGDTEVSRGLFQVLKPGGTLHICCPNSDHPYHQAYPLDPHETGGHVRTGYNLESYRKLLEPIGFELSDPIGVGGPWRHRTNEWVRNVEKIAGVGGGIIAFFFLLPLVFLDPAKPSVPFSWYVQAKKPKG